MNVVVDDRVTEQVAQVINPKFVVHEVNCSLEALDYDLEALIEKVYARCVDHKAELFMGKTEVCEELNKLGIRTIIVEDIINGK